MTDVNPCSNVFDLWKQDIFPVGHSCCGRGVISDLVNLLHVDNINSGKGLSGLRSNQTFFVHSI